MPTVSVTLNEETRTSLANTAARRGETVNTFVANAIQVALKGAHDEAGFIARALHARDEVMSGDGVFDGREFTEYLRVRARGKSAKRPRAQPIGARVKTAK